MAAYTGQQRGLPVRPPHDHVVRRSAGLDIGNDSQTTPPPPQYRSAGAVPVPFRADQDRQIGCLHPEALDKGFALSPTCANQRCGVLFRVIIPRRANRRRRSPRFSKDDRTNVVPSNSAARRG